MDGYVTIGARLDTKDFTMQIQGLERHLEDLEATLEMAREDDSLFDKQDVQEMEIEVEKLKNKLLGLYKQQEAVNKEGFSRATIDLDGIGSKLTHITKSVIRWGLALLGIRSAMLLVRGSLSILSQYDDQLAKNVEYIRYVIAMTLKPVIEYIVDLVFKLLQYINYIAQAWFGVNLFANASAKSFKNTNKQLEKANKNAKKLNKELLSFDKINKLNKDTSSSASASATSPSVDLSKQLKDSQVPEWVKWIADNKDKILDFLLQTALFLLAIKFCMGDIKKIGFAIVLWEIANALQELHEWYEEFDKNGEQVIGTTERLGRVVLWAGLAIVTTALFIGSIITALIGLFAVIIGWIVYWTDEAVNSINTIREELDNAETWLEDNLWVLGEWIYGWLDGVFGAVEGVVNGIMTGVSQVVSGILLILRGDLVPGMDSIFKGIGNNFIGILNFLTSSLNAWITPWRIVIREIGKLTGNDWKMSDIKIPKIEYMKTQAKSEIHSTQPVQFEYNQRKGIISYPNKSLSSGLTSQINSTVQKQSSLNDKESMDVLMDYLSKNLKINLNLTNEIDGRVLLKELKKLSAEDSFARNGG